MTVHLKYLTYSSLIFFIVFAQTVLAAGSRQTITVGFTPLNTQLPLIVSYENNKLINNDVDIKLVKYRSFTSLEAALRVGAIDIADLPVPMIFDMIGDGVGVRIVGTCHTGGSVLEGVGIRTLSDLKEKIIGVPGIRSEENLRIIKVLATQHLQYGLDYKTIYVPFHTILPNLEKGKINVMYFPEPYAYLAESRQISQKIESGISELQGGITTTLCVKDDVLSKQKKAMSQWLNSIVDACRFIEDDIEKSSAGQTAIIQESFFGFNRKVIRQTLVERRGNIRFFFSKVDSNVLEEILQESIRNRILKKNIPLQNITADIEVERK